MSEAGSIRLMRMRALNGERGPLFGSLFQRCLDSRSGSKANVATRHHFRSGQVYR